jgi:hypothetical protein
MGFVLAPLRNSGLSWGRCGGFCGSFRRCGGSVD